MAHYIFLGHNTNSLWNQRGGFEKLHGSYIRADTSQQPHALLLEQIINYKIIKSKLSKSFIAQHDDCIFRSSVLALQNCDHIDCHLVCQGHGSSKQCNCKVEGGLIRRCMLPWSVINGDRFTGKNADQDYQYDHAFCSNILSTR